MAQKAQVTVPLRIEAIFCLEWPPFPHLPPNSSIRGISLQIFSFQQRGASRRGVKTSQVTAAGTGQAGTCVCGLSSARARPPPGVLPADPRRRAGPLLSFAAAAQAGAVAANLRYRAVTVSSP